MFGPIVGDHVRLADTNRWIEVEKDFTVYGEEVKFGGDIEVEQADGIVTFRVRVPLTPSA